MTKSREPLSWADAMTRIVGLIGNAEAQRITGKSERWVYSCSDPDGTLSPTVAQAAALDAAYITAGGQEAPFAEAMSAQVGEAVLRQMACRATLISDLGAAAKETGEAIASGLDATRPGASPTIIHRALAEQLDARRAIGVVIRRLRRFVTGGAGSPVAKTGGNP